MFRARAQTSNIVLVWIPDSSSTTGAGKTGLSHSSGGLNISVRRELSSAVTSYTSASSNVETITTLGTYQAPTSGKCRFKEISSTNMPGWYEIHFADALFDASDASRQLIGTVQVTGGAPVPFWIPLSGVNPQDAVRGGMTALPNANAEAPGGLITLGNAPGLLVATTIASLSSQTIFTLTTGTAEDDAYNDQTAIITDQSTNTQRSEAVVSDYVGATKTVTLRSAPTFTIAAGDTIVIMASSALKPAVPRRTLAVDASGNASSAMSDSDKKTLLSHTALES